MEAVRSMSAWRAPLSDGRWHFQHGPIDIVIGAAGEADALAFAHEAAWQRFGTILQELVRELPVLRRALPSAGPLAAASERLHGPVARRMWAACAPYRVDYITPMAAVAGAVAQELIACYQRPGVAKAWVNNGGDIALHLAPGQTLSVGLLADLAAPCGVQLDAADQCEELVTDAQWQLAFDLPVRGIATSGWRGRSFSRGIADSVTVLALTAAQADAAATVIANAVDVNHPGIVKLPACELKDDSDLGSLLVTAEVPPLPGDKVKDAVNAGLAQAKALQKAGLIWFAALVCQGQWRNTGLEEGDLPLQIGAVFA